MGCIQVGKLAGIQSIKSRLERALLMMQQQNVGQLFAVIFFNFS